MKNTMHLVVVMIMVLVLALIAEAIKSIMPNSAQEAISKQGAAFEVDTLVMAMMVVESGMNPNIKGSAGELGVLQIRPIMVDECNRIAGYDKYSLSDRMNVSASMSMLEDYRSKYCMEEREEIVARRWNGGPGGDRKKATVSYWNKVKLIKETIDEVIKTQKAKGGVGVERGKDEGRGPQSSVLSMSCGEAGREGSNHQGRFREACPEYAVSRG